MRVLAIGFLLSLFSASASAEKVPPSPEDWYRLSYAPLWESEPWNRVDKMLDHYTDQVTTHEADGTVSTTAKGDWLAAPMAEWRAEGWLGSQMMRLETDTLNASTASFKASWLDRYSDGSTEISCGWYLADFQDGAWAFTQYADIDCRAHGLTQ